MRCLNSTATTSSYDIDISGGSFDECSHGHSLHQNSRLWHPGPIPRNTAAVRRRTLGAPVGNKAKMCEPAWGAYRIYTC